MLGLHAGLHSEANRVTHLSTSTNTVVFVLASSMLQGILVKCPEPPRQLIEAAADHDHQLIESAVAELLNTLPPTNTSTRNPSLAGRSGWNAVGSAQRNDENNLLRVQKMRARVMKLNLSKADTEPWARLVVSHVIWEGAFVPLSCVPNSSKAFVSTLPPTIAKARMKLRLTLRCSLAQGSGFLVWLGNFFGLRKVGDDLVMDEESDARLLARGILSPDGLLRTCWNCVMGVSVIYTCIIVPLNIGFDLEESDASAGVGHLVDTVFFLDILLTFRTAISVETDHPLGGDGRLNTVRARKRSSMRVRSIAGYAGTLGHIGSILAWRRVSFGPCIHAAIRCHGRGECREAHTSDTTGSIDEAAKAGSRGEAFASAPDIEYAGCQAS